MTILIHTNTVVRAIAACLCLHALTGTIDAADSAGLPRITRVAIDTAGMSRLSGVLGYVIDTHAVHVTIHPSGGVYNRIQTVTFDAEPRVQVYYSFDPITPPEWFKRYEGVLVTPPGINKIRYFGRDDAGHMSALLEQEFILDTVAPRLYLRVVDGPATDTLMLVMKKRGIIRYTLDGTVPEEGSPVHEVSGSSAEVSAPLIIPAPHAGRCVLRAIGIDASGNLSRPLFWERKYDLTPPRISMNPHGGRFSRPVTVAITTDKPAAVFYTLNGRDPRDKWGMEVQSGSVLISHDSTYTLRCRARDAAGNWSAEESAVFILDSRFPEVQVRITPAGAEGEYSVALEPAGSATIYYEIGGAKPSLQSPVYATPLLLHRGQSLAYQVADRYGNLGKVVDVDELTRPSVSAVPDGGIFNTAIAVHFKATVPGVIFWRMVPDSNFAADRDSAIVSQEGSTTIECYLKSMDGSVGAVHRSVFVIDRTPPRITIGVARKSGDSITLLVRSSKNADFYYTTDGSTPNPGLNGLRAGDKLKLSQDKITVALSPESRFCIFAQDIAGNRSAVRTLNLAKPQVTADVPPSGDHPYNKLLSITLASDAGATVHFSRHGRMATLDSPVFSSPLLLTASDTIIAFSVDASGLSGDADTLVYLIDLPPSAHFTVSPDTLYVGEQAVFDASTSIDKETPLSRLRFRWDFEGRGHFSTSAVSDPRATFRFAAPGRYSPRVEVTDERGNIGVYTLTLSVRDRCPAGMVATLTDNGRALCIDRYEYPNVPGRVPRTSVSWVEAKIACIDAGKRLCTRSEWESACRDGSGSTYPYGNTYDKKRCPSEGNKAWKSGSFEECSHNGIADMVGNVWEWVEDKKDDYPLMMGGSFREGKNAACGLAMPGSLSSRTEDVGFRCCK
jgi:hypothetical protein